MSAPSTTSTLQGDEKITDKALAGQTEKSAAFKPDARFWLVFLS